MNTKLPFTLLVSLGLAACNGSGAGKEAATGDALSAPGGDQCVLITNAAYLDLRAVLADGLADGQADALAYGVTGNYAAAALGLRDAFAEALRIVDEQYDLMQNNVADSDPNTTNYVEGSLTSGAMWQVIEQLQQAIHWGAVSEIYHGSAMARAGVEEALLASELAGALQAHGVRCYMDSYSAE